MLAQHDQASKRVLQAMLDVSKVLTPEQRATLGERMKQRQAMMQDRMQRMQRGPRQQPQQ
jgi:periplasmic protein CpxP/Spy